MQTSLHALYQTLWVTYCYSRSLNKFGDSLPLKPPDLKMANEFFCENAVPRMILHAKSYVEISALYG